MTRRNDLVYLRHMRDHAPEAMEILGATPRDELASARTVQLALLHLVEIVGEAAGRVSSETRSELASLPWRDIMDMRNRIIHGYDTVQVTMLWDTITEDLPILVETLETYLVEKKDRSTE